VTIQNRKCHLWHWAPTLFVNVVIAAVIYPVAGWHFIRGYNEVGNFIVIALVQIQAGLNLLLAMALAIWLVLARRGTSRAWSIAIGFAASALLVFLSPYVVPTIGRFAKHHRWIDTPLIEAVRYGDSELAAILVRAGADPKTKHVALEITPLHYVAARGDYQVVRLLLEKGADPNAQAFGLETPLHWAIRGRANVTTLEALAKFGANPDLEDFQGFTPLDYANQIAEPDKSVIYRVFGRTPIPDAPVDESPPFPPPG
jgi:hypothetical protein